MLRILIDTAPETTTLMLEGRLAGPWVEELARSWSSLSALRGARTIRINLEGVTFIGRDGKALLSAIHEAGADLVASGCMTRAIVNEIATTAKR